MSLKRLICSKIPSNMHDSAYFAALLDHVRKNDLSSGGELSLSLLREIENTENWLEENKNVSAKSIRTKVINLDMLRKCQKMTEDFLF